MNKKLLISVFLCFFVFSLGMLAAEKPYIKEFLGYYYFPRGGFGNAYKFFPTDPTQEEDFTSDPFLTFYVPASPKSKAIFFDIFAQAYFKWSGHTDRKAHCSIVFNIISDVIPSDIEVYTANAVHSVGETNLAGNYDTWYRRSWKRNWRVMERDNLDLIWGVKFKSGGDVPDNRAKKIINNLIDNGFSVEIHTEGTIQGVSPPYYLIACVVEVTRLSK